jgi:BsuBI/PstI restriction endonuclease domain/BsuBI/PstI restriction endonuclease HTH domain
MRSLAHTSRVPKSLRSLPLVDAPQLPALLPLDEVRRRLSELFPESLADRRSLVGVMAARVVFVFLYGGFVERSQRYLRPSHVYLFTHEQAARSREAERLDWADRSTKPSFRPEGRRWYADNSRESIRDDLMRNRLLQMGIIGKRQDIVVPTTSSRPVYFLAKSFAALFDPDLRGVALQRAQELWRDGHLKQETLQRMALKARGALKGASELLVDLPDGTRMRMAGGPSALIAKALIEVFAPAALSKPVVLWVSASDRKSEPRLAELAAAVGLQFDMSAELPDLILADLDEPMRIVFCEIVATDGAITPARKEALSAIVGRSRLPSSVVHFLSAFEDRASAPFRKNFSQLAPDSDVWFRTEPELIVQLRPLARSGLTPHKLD